MYQFKRAILFTLTICICLTSLSSNFVSADTAQEWYDRGFVYFGTGKYADAIDAYRNVIRLSPDYSNAYFQLGAAYALIKDYPSSIDALKQAIKLKPDNADAHYWLGMTYYTLMNIRKRTGGKICRKRIAGNSKIAAGS